MRSADGRPLGYTYEELMEATDGHFLDLLYEDDRKRFMSEFYYVGCRRCYRVVAKSGEVMLVTAYMGKAAEWTAARRVSCRSGSRAAAHRGAMGWSTERG